MFQRALPWAAFVVAVSFVVWHNLAIQQPRWMPDDSYISLRYAENFAAGRGPVYNEGERVEGYTNFLWVALLALGAWPGLDLVRLAQVYGIVCCAGTLLLLARAHRIAPSLSPPVSALATLLLGTCGVFSTWLMAGMETPMAMFWIVLAVLLHERGMALPEDRRAPAWAGVACALAAMTRPDAVLIFGALLLDRFIDGVRRRNLHFLWFGAVFTVIFGAYAAWRWNYYGYLLPNTFYVKVGGTWEQFVRGFSYTGRFFEATFFITALVPAAFLLPGAVGGPVRFRLLLCGIAALQIVYVSSVGGDFMPSFRFYASVLPLFCLLASVAITSFRPRVLATALFVCVALAYNAMITKEHRDIGERAGEGNVGRHGAVVGAWLRKHAPPDAVLATNTAGSIPFFSKLKTIDMLGLCDEIIAHREVHLGRGIPGHEKGDGLYVLSRKPDYIQFGSASGSARPSFLGDREIAQSPEFKRDYELRTYTMPDGGITQLYVRKASAGGKPLKAESREERTEKSRAQKNREKKPV